jgi:hypothetical protein
MPLSSRYCRLQRRKQLLATTVLFYASLALWVFGFEPFQVDPGKKPLPERSREIDHLWPIVHALGPLPEFDYLIQYWGEITTEDYHYLVVIRDEPSGRYYVEQGDAPKGELHGRPYRYKRRAEISADTAKLIYEYWVNMLLETRYDRKVLPYMPQVTVHMFSARAAVGWLHGHTDYPGVSEEMPPFWLAQAGEALFQFVTKTQNETELAAKIKELRDKYYDYRKAHPCN